MKNPPFSPARLAVLDAGVQRDVLRAVEAARPLEDLMEWLIRSYPAADRDWIFAALKVIYEGGFTIGPASQQAKTYRIGPEELVAFPQRVE